MTKSILDQASEYLLGPAKPEQAAPETEQDPQNTYGNAYLGGLFDQGEDDGGAAFKEMIEETRADISARVELDKVMTTGEGAEGKAQVSPEEYEEMVELYADISRGKTNLQIDTDGMKPEQAAAFKNGTMKDMAKLMQTKSGRDMLDSIARNENGKKVTLRGAHDSDKPHTSPLHKGRDYDHLDPEEKWEQNAALKRGDAASSQIEYTPGHTVSTKHDGDIRSDVVLYHELVHAHHFQNGTTARDYQGRMVKGAYVEDAELQATQGDGSERYSENRYRMERRRLGEDMARRETYHGRDVDELYDKANPCPAY